MFQCQSSVEARTSFISVETPALLKRLFLNDLQEGYYCSYTSYFISENGVSFSLGLSKSINKLY